MQTAEQDCSIQRTESLVRQRHQKAVQQILNEKNLLKKKTKTLFLFEKNIYKLRIKFGKKKRKDFVV